jgi:lactoylglutathione lyase
MRLFVELFVQDIDRARKFYRDVIGMKVVRNSPGYVELRSGEAQINLCLADGLAKTHYLRDATDTHVGSRVEFCLEVSNLQEVFQRAIDSGEMIKSPIERKPWGRTDFRMLDPDGAYLRITTPVE